MCSPLTHLLGSLGVVVVYELVLRMGGWVMVRKEDVDEMVKYKAAFVTRDREVARKLLGVRGQD